MKTPITDSVPERTTRDEKPENHQSSSNSEDNDELFEDCLSRNTSPAKSDTSADSDPSSDDTYYSLPDIENTVIELHLLSVSGYGTSTGRTINLKSENRLNAAALCPSHSSTVDEVTATRPSRENPLPSENAIKILNFPDNATESVETLNDKNANSSNSKAIEISDISGRNEQPPSDSSDSGWILVKSSAKTKSQSRSKTLSMSQASAKSTEIATPSSRSKLTSQTRVKTSSHRKPRGKVTVPKFTIRNPNINTSLRNPSYIIPTGPSIPPSAMVRNPKVGTCTRVSYSEVVGKSISAKRDVTIDLNPTAVSSDRPSADAFNVRDNDNAITSVSASLSANVENKTDDIAQIEQSKSNLTLNLSSNSSNCATYNPGISYRFNPAVGTPVRVLDMSCNLQDESQNDSLPILEGDDNSLPDHFGSDFANDLVLNLPHPSFPVPNMLLEQDESRMWEQPGIESTDKILRTNAPGTSEISSDLPNLIGMNSNLIDSSKPSLFFDEPNVNTSSISEGVPFSVKILSTKSTNASTTSRTEGLVLQPSSGVKKFCCPSGKKNEPPNFFNRNKFFTSDNFQSTEKAGLKKSLDIRAVCDSSNSDNVSPLFQQTNDALESQSITATNISHTSIRNETLESMLNKNGLLTSPQKKNTSIKSKGTNVSFKGRTGNISPAKSISKCQFQKKNENSKEFIALSNDGASSENTSISNAFPPCTDDKENTVKPKRNDFSSRSFNDSLSERPVLKNVFPHSSPERPILHSAFPHTSPVRTVSNSAFPHTSPVRTVSNSAFSHTSPVRPVLNRSFPPTFPVRPVLNSAVPHNFAEYHTLANRPVSNSAEPNNSANRLVSNSTVPHTSINRPVANSVQPHPSDNSSLLNSAKHPNSTGWPVSNRALPPTFPGHPISNYTFPQTENLNFPAFRGPFQMNTQPPAVQIPVMFQFRPPGMFYPPFAPPYRNFTQVPYTRMRQRFPSVPHAFSHSSGYSQPRIFVPQVFPGRSLAPQANHPPFLQQTGHTAPVRHFSTPTPDFIAQRASNPLFNPQADTGTRTTQQTNDEYPAYVCQDYPSGRGMTICKLRTTQSGHPFYSAWEMQFTDSESDTESDPESDDSSFTELSESELNLLNRDDYNRYFRRLERRRNRGAHHDSSAEETSKLPEKKIDNRLATVEPFYGINLDYQRPFTDKPPVKEGKINLTESEEENEYVPGEENHRRARSISEKSYLTHFMNTHPQLGQRSGFRRSPSYPGTSNKGRSFHF